LSKAPLPSSVSLRGRGGDLLVVGKIADRGVQRQHGVEIPDRRNIVDHRSHGDIAEGEARAHVGRPLCVGIEGLGAGGQRQEQAGNAPASRLRRLIVEIMEWCPVVAAGHADRQLGRCSGQACGVAASMERPAKTAVIAPTINKAPANRNALHQPALSKKSPPEVAPAVSVGTEPDPSGRPACGRSPIT